MVDPISAQVAATFTGFTIPPWVATAPDGNSAYVTNTGGSTASVIGKVF